MIGFNFYPASGNHEKRWMDIPFQEKIITLPSAVCVQRVSQGNYYPSVLGV